MGGDRKSIAAIVLLAGLLLFIPGCDDFSFYTTLDGNSGLRISAPGGSTAGTFSIIPEAAVIPIGTSYRFGAEGGIEPYTFLLVSGEGVIDSESGLFTAAAVPGSVTVAVVDGTGSAKEAEVEVVSVGEFTIAPTSISLYINNSTSFTALGGISPYSWSLVSGAGTIDAETGTYTAPAAPGSDVVRVTDSNGNHSDSAVTVLTPFSLLPSPGRITVNNTYTFTAEGGAPPYSFGLASGAGSIDSETGEYTAPASSGTAVVEAVDALGNSDSAEITIIPEASLLIYPASLTLNVDDTAVFSATGGLAPYEFTILSGGGSVGPTSGSYTAGSAPGTDIVRLTDSLGAVSDAIVTLVSSGPLAIQPASVSIEQDKSHDFGADGGAPPYVFSITAGQGTINSGTGLFTAPAATGAVTVRVTDSLGAFDESAVVISPAAPTDFIATGVGTGPTFMTLSWTDNASGEDGFIIERKQGAGAFAVIDTIAADAVTYLDDDGGLGLSPNNVYGYRIKAYKGAAESAYSNESYDIPNS